LPLPQPGAILSVSEKFAPAIMRGLTVYPENPLQFDFIIDTGDKDLDGPAFEEESRRLIKYFLAALTVPEKELWVNLSPYEGHRIIPEGLGVTEMGRDMLAQDYLLKQLTASLIYPEKEMGQAFWQKIYRKAYELYGTTNIPVNTFNKVWIVPDKAVVYEHDGSAFVVERHLKVMLEKDYLALRNNLGNEKFGMKDQPRDQAQELNDVSSQIVREILLPAIEQEVNEGETFANLRQIYNSMILATWYKKNLRSGLLGRVYMDQNKVKGIDLEDKAVKERIYAQYLETFKKGVYNYIREDYDETTRRKVPRKYFSGGLGVGVVTEDKLEVLRGGLRALPESVSSAITRPESSRGEDRRVTIELVENAVEDGGLSPVIDSLEFSSPIQEQEGQPRLKSRRQFLKEIFLIAGGLALTGSLPGAAAALTGGQEQVVSQVPRGSELEVLLKQLNPDNYEEQVQRLLDERRSLDWSEITAKQIIDGRIKEIYAKRVDAAKRLLELEDRRTVPGFIEAYRTGRLLFYKRSNSLDEYLEDLLVYSSKAFAMFGSKEAVPALLEGMGAGGLKIETLQITMNTLVLLEAEKEAVGVLFDVYYQTLSYPTYEHFFENVIDIRNAEIIPLLLEKLSEPSFSYMSVYQVLERMRVALRWLSRMGKDAEDAAPVIAEFLNRFKFRKSDVRLDILETLSVLGPYAYKAVPVLIKCLSNSNGYFAGKVAETLGAIGDLRAIPALVETLHYEGTAARSGALKALKAFPQNAHPVLQWDDTKDFPDLESLVSIYLKETASMKRIIALFLAAPFFKDRAVVFLKKKIAAENDQTLKEEYISLVTAIRYQTIERWIDNNKVETIIAGGAAGVLVIGGVKVTFGAWRKYTLRGNLYDLVHGNDKRSTYDIISNIISYKSRAVSRIISNFLEDDELKENDAFRYPEARLLDFLEHGVTADVIQKFSLLEKEHFSKLPDYLQRRLLDRAIENKQKEDLLSLKKYYASQPDTLYEVDEALVKLEGDYEDVLNFYIKNLENISIYNRERAVLRLGEIGDLRAVPIIEKYLSIVEAGQLVEERGYWEALMKRW
ncbi:MAG TPA: HEAT repeat domain-containing protein, partial [Candidatus Omnitrophota bacterium]|nr:HEAT repeat domain-containing protein [Candidatus Omnitrophota bacterium]